MQSSMPSCVVIAGRSGGGAPQPRGPIPHRPLPVAACRPLAAGSSRAAARSRSAAARSPRAAARSPRAVACCLFVALLLRAPAAGAVLERAGEHILDAGAFRLFMTNLGIAGNPTYPSFSDHPSLEWPAGTAHEFLLEAGLWVGARDRSASLLGVSTAVPVSEFRPSLDPVDRIYASFDGDQGTRRLGSTPEVEDADDDGDGRIDEEFLNGKDDDGDGRIDEDFVALGAQSLSCEYRDDTPEAQSQLLAHVPLLLRVRQQTFTWSEGTGELDRCAVFRYQVTNTGTAALYDVLLGFFVDPDVGPKAHDGYWRDDRYAIETVTGSFPARGEQLVPGCRTVPFERPVVIVEDVPDGQPGANGGDVPGLVAALVLDHTTHRWGYRAPEDAGPSAIVHLRGRASLDRTREEISDAEKYALMASGRFMGNNETTDHRFILVAGPYSELRAGETIDLTVTLVVAADRDELQRTAAALLERFYGRWANLDGSIFSGRDGAETYLTRAEARFCGFTPFEVDTDCDEPQTQLLGHAGCRSSQIEIFCPAAPDNRCTPRAPVGGRGVWVDFDCNRCTPNVIGGESLVRWADTDVEVSSRPVAKRVTPGDREVVVEWDNAPELPTAALALPPVAGYQVWRADGWRRPPGSSGPTRDAWALIATLPLPASGLPPPAESFIDAQAPVVERVPGPGDSLMPHYAIGRYRYVDRGVLNGFATFYDVTPFALEEQSGGTEVLHGLDPRARSGQQTVPVAVPAPAGAGGAAIRVVPNPYIGSADWDLEPSRSDPSGRKIQFIGLPAGRARVEIFTLGGDLVRALENAGQSGAVDWDLLSRNGQPVAAGIYLYTVEAAGVEHLGRLVIVR